LEVLLQLRLQLGKPEDIPPLLQFCWFEPVLYSIDHSFVSDSPKKSGHWVSVAETQGGALIYLILTDDLVVLLGSSPVKDSGSRTRVKLSGDSGGVPGRWPLQVIEAQVRGLVVAVEGQVVQVIIVVVVGRGSTKSEELVLVVLKLS
jgi:hypothetical protein